MHFLRLNHRKYFSTRFDGPRDAQVSRWRPDGFPSVWLASINPGVTKWLEENAQGRWYFVNNRLKTTIEEITVTSEEKKRYRVARAEGWATEEMIDRHSTKRELAFELKSDMLLFKLSYL
jgi:hypothetical protein